jgi:DNA invertase Pin-like site-specific DNA recombinase
MKVPRKPPFGYIWDGSKLIIDNEKKDYVKAIFERAALGVGYSKIAELLNNAGQKTSNGNSFSKQTVKNMIENKTYIGISIIKNEEVTDHEAIISEDLFYKIQNKEIIPLI